MADFKTKLITCLGMTVAFSGMAFGQVAYTQFDTTTLQPVTATTTIIRSEGNTELLGNPTVSIAPGTAVSTVTLTAYINTGANLPLPITSSSTSGVSVITLTSPGVNGGVAIFGTPGPANAPNTVSFTFTTTASPANTPIKVTLANIRVNATGIVSPPTAPPVPVSIQFFMTGTNVNTNTYTNPVNLAFAQAGLGGATSTVAVANNLLCNAVGAGTLQFTVNVSEGFATSFKTKADEGGGATNGTRISVTFNGVPTNVTLYVPLTVTSSAAAATAQLTLTGSATGTFAATAAASGLPGLAAVTVANNSGTVIYETTTDDPSSIDTFKIGAFYVSSAGAVAISPAVTATVAFAPIGTSSTVPNFTTANSVTVNGSGYIACSTVLLFPYVTNASGFETGLTIANTSTDVLAAGGKNSVAAQSGTCSLAFYGGATNPATYTVPNVTTGTVSAFTLTTAAGANFTGYAIANCNFQYGHGFAYIVYNFGTTSGTAMGYLAEVVAPGTRGVIFAEALNN